MKEDIKGLMEDILRREAEAVLSIPVSDGYEQAVGLIVEHVNRRGGKLITSVIGKAGQISMN
ncbi:MAG: iron dicitrate transport regulator FecR, partial [Muribaculaceae bacterium]|nr:iron dicitrate transport regulator FecR [Muribaculaceae bacterium]